MNGLGTRNGGCRVRSLSEHTGDVREGYCSPDGKGFLSDGGLFHTLIRCSISTPVAEDDKLEILARRPIASFNYLLSSCLAPGPHGFRIKTRASIDHAANQKSQHHSHLPAPRRKYSTTLVADHCLRSRTTSILVVAANNRRCSIWGQDAAVKHCTPASASGNGQQ